MNYFKNRFKAVLFDNSNENLEYKNKFFMAIIQYVFGIMIRLAYNI